MAKIVELIESESTEGSGTDDDPVRVVYELWTKGGFKVAAWDSWKNTGWYRPQ